MFEDVNEKIRKRERERGTNHCDEMLKLKLKRKREREEKSNRSFEN